MSWSVSAIGKASAVEAKLANDFTQVKCIEPEETIKELVATIVATALAAFPGNYAVEVTASGSQSQQTDGTATNNLSVQIKPIYGFVE